MNFRRKTREVRVGDVILGGKHPIVVQSMTTHPTSDVLGTTSQIQRLVQVGCEIVRLTIPSMKDLENVVLIRQEMKKKNLKVPLVADIHFLPEVALKACEVFEKVRINPGNFADRKQFVSRSYSEVEYQEELDRVRSLFRPLLLKAKENGVALRIGTNHGSLSDRIVNRFGDTPKGMVESAIEFLLLAEEEKFHDLVISMKASNPIIMMDAYRLLVKRMDELQMNYPLHLGVTEAGEGEDGRVRSSLGIGVLLSEGIGDTIRVSLTEEPEAEIPVAQKIAQHYTCPLPLEKETAFPISSLHSFSERRKTKPYQGRLFSIGGNEWIRVCSSLRLEKMDLSSFDPPQEIVCVSSPTTDLFRLRSQVHVRWRVNSLSELQNFSKEIDEVSFPLKIFLEFLSSDWKTALTGKILWIRVHSPSEFELLDSLLEKTSLGFSVGVELESSHLISLGFAFVEFFQSKKISFPLHLHWTSSPEETEEDVLVRAPVEIGSLLFAGIGDGIQISSPHPDSFNHRIAFNVLQASRKRISKAEYISCPSCGRTQFNIQETVLRIRNQTHHLTGVKIAVMGCIVNGPGEMADADFGYVGAGADRVNLYVGKQCVERGLPSSRADQALLDLIRKNGRWTDPK